MGGFYGLKIYIFKTTTKINAFTEKQESILFTQHDFYRLPQFSNITIIVFRKSTHVHTISPCFFLASGPNPWKYISKF